MITKYFTQVCIKFNPFGPEARCARSVLSQIPPSMKGACKIDLELLSKDSKKEPFVQVTFKDSTVMNGNPAELTLADFTNMLDKHSKKLLFKEEVDK
ncbi:39S ribosomal protein L44, mitochondrial [Pichia californica]|uniref:Large ribosomal subunit protein mL53 n=1 Tax=Pichia californica TaxID=460514 RepID=A0A9P7BGX5_9ASCO|nr:39S ribosomal protein L44, mitochondrial [[Candida] californica]KAG0690601.1 39S ribosomal protein L44, mitochondrial [[Candida] californica]